MENVSRSLSASVATGWTWSQLPGQMVLAGTTDREMTGGEFVVWAIALLPNSTAAPAASEPRSLVRECFDIGQLLSSTDHRTRFAALANLPAIPVFATEQLSQHGDESRHSVNAPGDSRQTCGVLDVSPSRKQVPGRTETGAAASAAAYYVENEFA